MKSEVFFSDQIGLYELSQYAQARYWTNQLKIERDLKVQELYDDCSPTITQFDYDQCRSFVQSTPVEDMAIMIIDEKEKYRKMIDKHERKAHTFEQVIDELTPRERDVIQVAYQGRENDLGLSNRYFNEVLQEAELKLCSLLTKAQFEKRREFSLILKEERKEKAKRIKVF